MYGYGWLPGTPPPGVPPGMPPHGMPPGHEWVRQRVARRFEGQLVLGLITKWAPASAEDTAMWHMVHDDGDEEDLDEAEMREAIALQKCEHGGPARGESSSRTGRKRTAFDAAALQGKRRKS